MNRHALCVATLAIATVSSCGSPAMFRPPPVEQPVPTASGPPPPLGDSPSTQIEQLHADLLARRTALALPSPQPGPDDACEPVCKFDDPPQAAAGCTPGSAAACTGTCTQATAACDDAVKICEIARQLRTEAWAAARCHDASATCADAHRACCACT